MNLQIERKWQREWYDKKIFEPSIDKNKSKFFITVPYPYANASLHIGHGRAYTIGDVIARYKRAEGYNVLFPMAFHVTGTPILAIVDLISKSDKETVKLYREYLSLYESSEQKIEEYLKKFKDPESLAMYFAEKIQLDFERLGYSIDWSRKFNTANPNYNRFVEWQFKKLHDLNLIKKGEYPLLFSIVDGNPVGEDDIKEGDVDKVSIIEFTSIKFKFENGYILAGSLRPETIFGITNLWVNPEAEYAEIKIKNESFYVSKEAYEKLTYQQHDTNLIRFLHGSYFVDKRVDFNLLDLSLLILPCNFVDPANATGFVYSVPAHAPYDLMALKDLSKTEKYRTLNIDPVKIIDVEGYKTIPAEEICTKFVIKDQNDPKLEEATKILYKDEFYNGTLNEKCRQFKNMKVSEIKDRIKTWLSSNNSARVFYETSRKAVTRSGNKVIVSIMHDQWFIDYKNLELKSKSYKLLNDMLIVPEKYRAQISDVIDWLRERPCARKRGLGTKLPFDPQWTIEALSDSTIYMAFYTIYNIIKKYDVHEENLTENFFDSVFFKVLYNESLKKEILIELQNSFEYWYPIDLRVTATPHLSNHLTFFIMNHAALFSDQYWPRGIGLMESLIREGAKMSKSKGNVIPLSTIANHYSADLFRLYIISAADLGSELDWKESDVDGLRRKLEKFVELVTESVTVKEKETDTDMDRWLYSRFYSRLKIAHSHIKSYRFRDAVIELFFNVINDIKYYEKREGAENREKAVKKILDHWLVFLSPIIPHICEEFWHYNHTNFISLEPLPAIKEELIIEEIEKSVEYVENVVEDIKHILELIKNQVSTIYIYPISQEYLNIIENAKTLSRGELMKKTKNKNEINFINKLFNSDILSVYYPLNESKVLENTKDYLEHEFKLKIIINSEHDPKNKRGQALPLKPAIYVE